MDCKHSGCPCVQCSWAAHRRAAGVGLVESLACAHITNTFSPPHLLLILSSSSSSSSCPSSYMAACGLRDASYPVTYIRVPARVAANIGSSLLDPANTRARDGPASPTVEWWPARPTAKGINQYQSISIYEVCISITILTAHK